MILLAIWYYFSFQEVITTVYTSDLELYQNYVEKKKYTNVQIIKLIFACNVK